MFCLASYIIFSGHFNASFKLGSANKAIHGVILQDTLLEMQDTKLLILLKYKFERKKYYSISLYNPRPIDKY